MRELLPVRNQRSLFTATSGNVEDERNAMCPVSVEFTENCAQTTFQPSYRKQVMCKVRAAYQVLRHRQTKAFVKAEILSADFARISAITGLPAFKAAQRPMVLYDHAECELVHA